MNTALDSFAANVRKAFAARDARMAELERAMATLRQGQSADPYDAIPGRRIFYVLAGQAAFDTTVDGKVGTPILLQVSQDGPFIATHWPVIAWKPALPTTATNFGRWRPVFQGPLPTQQYTSDFISLSYQLQDSGSGRQLQSQNIMAIMSRMDELRTLPRPTLLKANSTLTFTPFYEDIDFGGSTPTTGGVLVVGFPGYRIIPDVDVTV